MYIQTLDEDNIENYTDYVTLDVAENIGRTFYRGILAIDGESPVAGMVWEVRHMMQNEDNESNIVWLRIDASEAEDPLFENYKTSIREDEVVKSTFSLPAKSSAKEKEALSSAGFSVKFMEGDLIKARLSEIAELSFIQKITPSEDVRPLSTITQRGFNAAVRQYMTLGRFGLCEDLPYLSRSFFENDISCYYESGGQVNGLLLFHKNPSEGLVVVIMASIGNDYAKVLPQMIKFSVLNATEIYAPDTEVWIDRHNYPALALSEKLFPRGFGIPVYVGERLEKQ